MLCMGSLCRLCAVLSLLAVILRDEGEIQGSVLVAAMLTVSTDTIKPGFQRRVAASLIQLISYSVNIALSVA